MDKKLDKYFSGEMPASEKKEFFTWLQTEPDEKKEFARIKNTLAITELTKRETDEENTSKGMEELYRRIHLRSIRHHRLNMLKYAAVALVLVAASWFLSAEYTLRNQPSLYTEVNAPKGQRVNMTLADGSTVWLSPRTKIRIPNQFNRNSRTIELDGEGYFSVIKNTKQPFIVKTQQYNIEVLGTHFNVFSYSERDRFETSLVEGSVLVYNKDNKEEQIYLNPNEKVSLINNVMVKSKSDFDNKEYLNNGIFSFRSKPFVDILDYLSLWYNVEFKVTGTMALTRKISGKFRLSEEVENILEALQSVHHFNYKKITDDLFEIY